MPKFLKIGDKHFRLRRNRWVEIPPEWLHNVTTPATVRQRPSKLTGKKKRAMSRKALYRDAKFAPIEG